MGAGEVEVSMEDEEDVDAAHHLLVGVRCLIGCT